ncbi:MAG: hypothetical protein JW755_02380 [Candidatus Aminicenantes bacterium]|nr:hypothetical protein [Candidatus Aminicenantes bacterium]
MKKNLYIHYGMVLLLLLVCLIFLGKTGSSHMSFSLEGQELVTHQKRGYEDLIDLINETDLYCSFFILNEDKPEIKIIGSERQEEREVLNNGDTIYLNAGEDSGITPGDLFIIYDISKDIPGFGPLAQKMGRARVMYVTAEKANAQIEKACGDIRIGNYLSEFEEKEGFVGKNLGLDVPPYYTDSPVGEVIYLQTDFAQIGPGYWALIDLGRNRNLSLGQQLIIFREVEKDAPLKIIANVVVIDVQEETSTIKILTARDSVIMGDKVQFRPE